ncbi:family 20 glycosylhydrolase [Candidatus Sumerlaeota bacterium]|nr:family 20 glycosylhydrolase [Candidatus Sumerlaeota bacterium]
MRRIFALLMMALLMVNYTYGVDKTISRDGLRVTMGKLGPIVDVDGVPFNMYSEFSVVDFEWHTHYFGYEMMDMPTLTEASETTMITKLSGINNTFVGEERISILPERVLRIDIDGKLDVNTSGKLQLIYASIYPEWFAGAHYTLIDADDKTTTGILPVKITYSDYETLTLTRGFKLLAIAGPLGTVTFRPSGTYPTRFVDYRGNPFSSSNMQYIVGPIGEEMENPTTFTACLDIQFGRIAPIEQRDLISSSPVVKAEKVLLHKSYEDRIVPTPKNVEWQEGVMALTIETGLLTKGGEKDNEFLTSAAANLAMTVKRRTNIDLALDKKDGVNTIELVLQGEPIADKTDHYKVNITPDRTILESPTTSGLVCAIKTFRQLMRPADRTVRCAKVEDWAAMPVRGIHFYTGSGDSARKAQINLLQNVLSEFKLNTLLFECSHVNWKSLPYESEKHNRAMDLDIVKDLIRTARDEFIEIVPLINTYGHSEWFLDNKKRTHLADDSETNYTYDATNPEVYQLLEPVYRECVELFKPRAVHIGHDEISNSIFYPKKEAAKAIGKQELFFRDTMHWHDFLTSMGVKMWMWSDMLYHFSEVPDAGNAPTPEEAKTLRERLPKDIVVVDWHYAPVTPDKFTGLAILNKLGISAIGATWDTVKNIMNFAQAVANAIASPEGEGKTLGMIHTTWSGYNLNEQTILDAYKQYAQYVYAAEMMWNGGHFGGDGKEYDWGAVFASAIGSSLLSDSDESGFVVPLVSDPNKTGKPYMTIEDCGAFADRVNVGTAAVQGQSNGLLLAGLFNRVGSDGGRGITKAELPINATAKQIVITGAVVNTVPPGTKVATIAMEYEDGTTSTIALHAEHEIVSLLSEMTRPNLTAVKLPTVAEQADCYLHYYTWANPNPEKLIKKMTIKSECTQAGVFIRGITGIE